MQNELKLCPFCGGEVRPMFIDEEENACVYEGEEIQYFKCFGCDTEFVHSEAINNPQTQLEWWNRRANDIKAGFYNENVRNMGIAIGNGTPLPKGHGKIGDIDRLYQVFEKNVVSASAFRELFDNAPTIIESDKEE